MRNIVVTTPVKPHHRDLLEQAAAGRCALFYGRDALPGAEAVIGDLRPKEIAAIEHLAWYHLVWAGVDHFRPEMLPPGCRFTNGSGVYGAMIAEHMLACILSFCRQLPHYAALQRLHRWDTQWHESTLEGRTVLILGTGDIGSALARRLRGFDCTILGICRRPRPIAGFDRVYGLSDLDSLLPRADVVACVLPATPQTAGLFDRRRLLRLKPQSILVNCGRGSLIDLAALAEAMDAVPLLGCALDVTDPEPLPPESPLWDMDRMILTPHVSGASFDHLPETEDKIYRLAADNLNRYLSGLPLRNEVDFAAGYRIREV